MSNESKTLKPVSAFERGLLALLDEDVSDHQARMAKRLRGEKVEAKKEAADPILKKLQDGTAKIGPTIAEAALALEQRVERWKEDAYVIFIAHTTCRGCGTRDKRQLDPHVYLRSIERKPSELRTARYVPVRSISNWTLPRVALSTFHTTFACAECFEGLEKPWELEVIVPSTPPSEVDTASPADPLNLSVVYSQSLPVDSTPPASISGEDIEMSTLSLASSFQAVGDSSESNFVMSPCRNYVSGEEKPADASDFDTPIAELTIANSMNMQEG